MKLLLRAGGAALVLALGLLTLLGFSKVPVVNGYVARGASLIGEPAAPTLRFIGQRALGAFGLALFVFALLALLKRVPFVKKFAAKVDAKV